MGNDYRCSDYCRSFDGIKERKAVLGRLVAGTSKYKNMYKAVSLRDSRYHHLFACLYHGKCAYCGADLSIYDQQSFEVDHFLCQDRADSVRSLNDLSNLVNACRSCNSKKSNFYIRRGKDLATGRDYSQLLDPDGEDILQVFVRDPSYRIRIASEYHQDQVVIDYYRTLALGSQTMRLDYLLLQMRGLEQTCRDEEISGLLCRAIEKLQKLRNRGAVRQDDEAQCVAKTQSCQR